MSVGNRTFLVTGASGGIGRACAKALAAAGFSVVLHYGRSADSARALCEEILAAGGSARTLSFDVGDCAAARVALEEDIAAHGAYWGLVLCAGITRDAAFPAMSAEDWGAVINTDLNAFFNVVQPCVMPMIGLRLL